MKLGSLAPDFTLFDDQHEKKRLKDFRGQTVVLYFYPKAMTSGCTQQACDFESKRKAFHAKGAVLIGISPDPVEKLQKFKEKEGLTFTLLSDPDATVSKAYGVWQEKSMYGKKYMGIVRSTFVIDPNGRLVAIHEKVKVNGHAQTILKEVADVS